MGIKKNIFLLLGLLSSLFTIAQPDPAASQPVDMADAFYTEGKVYIVVVIVSIVVLGILLYLFLLDRKLARIEKELKK
jgi:CcmD family protein